MGFIFRCSGGVPVATDIRVRMPQAVLDELEEALMSDSESDLRKFMWDILKSMCKDAKMARLHRRIRYQYVAGGRVQAKDGDRTDPASLPELPSDPSWRPDDMDESDEGTWTHKVTDKTWEYAGYAARILAYRTDRFVESLREEQAKEIRGMEERVEAAGAAERKALERGIEDLRKAHAETVESHEKGRPSCIEHAVYLSVIQPVMERIAKGMDAMWDAEDEQANPKEEKKEGD